jgi:hypothetical protein
LVFEREGGAERECLMSQLSRVCLRVCVCVCERERERERESIINKRARAHTHNAHHTHASHLHQQPSTAVTVCAMGILNPRTTSRQHLPKGRTILSRAH